MSAAGGGREDQRVRESQIEIAIDAEQGDVTITLDRTHSMLAAVRDARRAAPPPLADDDPRHEVFERELRMLLRMARQDAHYTEDFLLAKRNEFLDRIDIANDLERLFDEIIDSVLTARTVDACVNARFHIRLLAAVMSIYRPDIYTSGALEIGQHFYGRAERRLVTEGAITDHELLRAL
ncbi:MAG: hypothetical protein OEM81_14470 [Acidimicrobiia bacterium]|nr:hypothetical protein [Acidimicrobiia bacterium]MDH3399014.1 hypothetical protein [Acidimicrobiia bacterium]MDH5615236.1 hypothetical protein [Acidimicrobiia bacterium]